MEEIIDPNKAIKYIIKHSEEYAKAKAKRVYLDEFRKSQKAILMMRSTEETLGAREAWAYSHPEYLEVLSGLREAVEIEEKLRWDLIAAQARIEVYRTQSANNRFVDKVVT